MVHKLDYSRSLPQLQVNETLDGFSHATKYNIENSLGQVIFKVKGGQGMTIVENNLKKLSILGQRAGRRLLYELTVRARSTFQSDLDKRSGSRGHGHPETVQDGLHKLSNLLAARNIGGFCGAKNVSLAFIIKETKPFKIPFVCFRNLLKTKFAVMNRFSKPVLWIEGPLQPTSSRSASRSETAEVKFKVMSCDGLTQV